MHAFALLGPKGVRGGMVAAWSQIVLRARRVFASENDGYFWPPTVSNGMLTLVLARVRRVTVAVGLG